MVIRLTDKRRRRAANMPERADMPAALKKSVSSGLQQSRYSSVHPHGGTQGFGSAAVNASAEAELTRPTLPKRGAAGTVQQNSNINGSGTAPKAENNSAPTNGTNPHGATDGTGADEPNSFEDYYTRLIEALHGYGIALTLPTLEELYGQLEQFLRPAIDSAIENRRQNSAATLAELDADAYSRGMGGSTYLSGIKQREYDAAAADIAMLEANYDAQLAKYLYDAVQELADIQQSFAEMQLRHRQDMEKLRAQQSGKSSGGKAAAGSGKSGSSGGKNDSSGGGSYPDGSGKYYNYYCAYLSHLPEREIDSVFFSNSSEWSIIREQMRQRLGEELYELIMRRFVQSGA